MGICAMVPWEPALVKSRRACKNLLFPYTPSRLPCTDFKQPHGSSLAMTKPQKREKDRETERERKCESVCVHEGRGREEESRREEDACTREGSTALRQGTAGKGFP